MNKPAETGALLRPTKAALKRPTFPAAIGGESAGYISQGSDQLYYVRHRPERPPIGQVVMAGPFGAENEPLYILWVRWARYLAAHGLDVIRFDYRGVGESTGEFQQMDFGAWLSDLQLCCHRLTSDDLPLVLHGLGLGALLAARAFHEGIGDATLLWSPPPNGREILQYSLRRHTAAGYGRRTSAVVVTRQDCIRSLEAGEAVTVDGYVWSPRLWRQSLGFRFIDPAAGGDAEDAISPRPHRTLYLDQGAGPLFLPWGEMPVPRSIVEHLNPDLTPIFRDSCDWICRSVAVNARVHARDIAG